MPWILPLIFVIIFELIADVFSKEWSMRTNLWYLALGGMLSYIIANAFWLFTLKNGAGLGRGVVIFSVSTAITATILGLVWYQEKVTNLQVLGMIVGIISIVLIFWE